MRGTLTAGCRFFYAIVKPEPVKNRQGGPSMNATIALRKSSLAFQQFFAAVVVAFCACTANAQVLLDDKWADGSRAESKLPQESAVWVGRKADVSVKPGAVETKLTPASQKIWTYFADKKPITLKVGQKLVASVSFIPRGKLSETSSRSLRIGLFHDATSPRVEKDINNDGGGPDAPWTDAKGYAVQVLVTGGEYSSTKPFDLGKRMNLESKSLLGTSADYSKVSGGEPAALALDKEYTVTFEIDHVSEAQVDLTVSYRQGKEQLSTWSVVDDGNYLGTEPIYDQFDLLFLRLTDNTTIADRIDFTNFKVELMPIDAKKQAAR
jgi:hypothetical protein